MPEQKKKIFIIGATGVQGRHVIEALLQKSKDGSPSPYSIIGLTRSIEKTSKQDFFRNPAIKLVEGSIQDMDIICQHLTGSYGAFINIDSFTVGEKTETWAGTKIFDMAKGAGIKHYIWSSLDNMLAAGGFDPKYTAHHYTAKSRVGGYMQSIPSAVSPDKGMVWTSLVTGPYTEMLTGGSFNPKVEENGDLTFYLPMGKGVIPLIELKDIGYYARYIFDHPEEYAGKDFKAG